MATRQFQLITEWRLDAPLAAVWSCLHEVETWPDWWPSVTAVETLAEGGPDGIGAVRRLHWATALPYTLCFDVEVVALEPCRRIEGRAFGELEGRGIWTLERDGEGTLARYDWRVDVTKAWMRALAPLLRPVFAWNHGVVMRRGEAGLAHWLTGRLTE